jgi:hypothetical protein
VRFNGSITIDKDNFGKTVNEPAAEVVVNFAANKVCKGNYYVQKIWTQCAVK